MKIEMICPVCKENIKDDNIEELTYNEKGYYYIISASHIVCPKCRQLYYIGSK